MDIKQEKEKGFLAVVKNTLVISYVESLMDMVSASLTMVVYM